MNLRLLAFLFFTALGPHGLAAAEVNIFAAASLSDALSALAQTYQSTSGDRLHINFAGSSLLARQIKEGAPADLFFSADEAKMDDLARAGLILVDTRTSLLSNTLVVIVNSADEKGRLIEPADLAKPTIKRIALAEPNTVPAGIYAKEYLQKVDLWSRVKEKIVPTENVRGCLAAVESGNVDAGLVYKTDALLSKKIKIAYEISPSDGPKISYPLAVLKNAKAEEGARKFAIFLASPEARARFVQFGFIPMRRDE